MAHSRKPVMCCIYIRPRKTSTLSVKVQMQRPDTLIDIGAKSFTYLLIYLFV